MSTPTWTPEQLDSAYQVVNIYRDAIESFGLIHQGRKEWDRAQRMLMAELGIEQARLLAWGHIVGISIFHEERNPRLDEVEVRQFLVNTFKSIETRANSVARPTLLDRYGLKPSKKVIQDPEQALDSTRFEVFREQHYAIDIPPGARLGVDHWAIADNGKFKSFIVDTRRDVNALISAFDVNTRVEQAVKSDIKALAWHPVFDRMKAATDGSKLRLIQDACRETYPVFSEATVGALAYLHKQWQDSYEEDWVTQQPRPQHPGRSYSETPVSKTTKAYKDPERRASEDDSQLADEKPHGGRKSIMSLFRPLSWRRNSTASTSSANGGANSPKSRSARTSRNNSYVTSALASKRSSRNNSYAAPQPQPQPTQPSQQSSPSSPTSTQYTHSTAATPTTMSEATSPVTTHSEVFHAKQNGANGNGHTPHSAAFGAPTSVALENGSEGGRNGFFTHTELAQLEEVDSKIEGLQVGPPMETVRSMSSRHDMVARRSSH